MLGNVLFRCASYGVVVHQESNFLLEGAHHMRVLLLKILVCDQLKTVLLEREERLIGHLSD